MFYELLNRFNTFPPHNNKNYVLLEKDCLLIQHENVLIGN